jgi:hypothetical protein
VNTSLTSPRRIAIALLIVSAAFCVWIPHQLKLRESRIRLNDARTELILLSNRLAVAAEALESTRHDLKSETDTRNQALADVAKAERALAASNPEARWAVPPATLPEWNAESPYVWLRKEMMPRFPVPAFSEEGGLQPEIAYIFTLDPATQRDLNQKLKACLAEYRSLEAAAAKRSDEHLPGIAGQTGEKMTLRVQPLPEEGARIKAQFEAALLQALGEQRTTLLKRIGENWLDSQFAQFGAETKIISVLRRPGGNISISIKTGNNWFSTDSPAEHMKNYLPPHLRSLFSEVFDKANDTARAP